MTSNARSADDPLPQHRGDGAHVTAGLVGFASIGFMWAASIASYGPTGAAFVAIAIATALVIAVPRVEFRPYLVTGLLCFLLAGWMSVLLLGLFFASVATAPLFGTEPGPEDYEQARTYLQLTFAASVAVTLAGLGLAIRNQRTRWKVVYGVGLSVMVVATLLALISG